MNAFREEVERLGLICYSVFWLCAGFLFMTANSVSSTFWFAVISALCSIGFIITPIFFIVFAYHFVEESIQDRHWSSTWTWLMRHKKSKRIICFIGAFLKKIVQKFVTGNYVGFKRLCLLIIGVCMIIYAVPFFHSEGLMALPAISMFWSIVFIVKG